MLQLRELKLAKKMVPETTEIVKMKERVKSELYSTTGGNQSTVRQLDKWVLLIIPGQLTCVSIFMS